jgi:hypothetical protein
MKANYSINFYANFVGWSFIVTPLVVFKIDHNYKPKIWRNWDIKIGFALWIAGISINNRKSK